MKIYKYLFFILFLNVHSSIFSADYSKIIESISNPRLENGWVADKAGILSSGKISEMNRAISSLENDTTAEVAVVILPEIENFVPRDFATALFRSWGIGKKDKNNGVLILHITGQRRIEIETGYGMEGILTDAKCKYIIENAAIPEFKKGNFQTGHLMMLKAVINGIRNPKLSPDELVTDKWVRDIPEKENPENKKSLSPKAGFLDQFPGLIGVAIIVLIFSFLWFFITRSKDPANHPEETHQYIKKSTLKYLFILYALSALIAVVMYVLKSGGFYVIGGAVLIPGAGISVVRMLLVSWMRKVPRICSVCGQSMVRLDEIADDEFLSAGERVEEQLKSKDYDIWKCSCGQIKKEVFGGWGYAEKCPKCGYMTLKKTGEEIITYATYTSTGLKRLNYLCANCHHKYSQTKTIPVKTSSSSGGSRSSGGSFGGGSSGGGGAGGSY